MMWHGFGMFGMGGAATDPGESGFSRRVAQLGVDIHNSPYRDFDAGLIASIIDKLPPEDGVFVWGTSLGCNNTPIVCNYTQHRIDGAFGFQASIYGTHSSLSANCMFAHLIYSYNPIPFPGLGAYIWQVGSMSAPSYHKTPHHIPHPGDYDINDQNMFLGEMQSIMKATAAPKVTLTAPAPKPYTQTQFNRALAYVNSQEAHWLPQAPWWAQAPIQQNLTDQVKANFVDGILTTALTEPPNA